MVVFCLNKSGIPAGMYPGTDAASTELRTKGTVGGAPPRGQSAMAGKMFYSCMNAALPYGVSAGSDCHQAKALLGPMRNCARFLGLPEAAPMAAQPVSGLGEMNSLLDIYEGAAGLGAGPGAYTYQPGTFRLSSAAIRGLASQPRMYSDGVTGTGESEMPTVAKVAVGVGLVALLGVVYMAVRLHSATIQASIQPCPTSQTSPV